MHSQRNQREDATYSGRHSLPSRDPSRMVVRYGSASNVRGDIHSKKLAKTAGLTAPQLMRMQAIRNSKEDSTIGTLANQISLSQAAVNNIIGRLESRGLITRKRSETDKRFVWLHLTQEGEKTLDRAPIPLQEQFVRRFSKLENWEQNMILSSLQRLAAMMDADGIDASPFLEVGALDRTDEQ